eukprot:902962-Rhodomonas_salina.2
MSCEKLEYHGFASSHELEVSFFSRLLGVNNCMTSHTQAYCGPAEYEGATRTSATQSQSIGHLKWVRKLEIELASGRSKREKVPHTRNRAVTGLEIFK